MGIKEETIPLNEAPDERRILKERKDWIPARWIMAGMGCFGFMSIYGLKVNLSVAIIAMVNHTVVASMGDGHEAKNVTSLCEGDDQKEVLEDGPFVWDENIQGFILGSYFYGYIVTQVPGGWFAEKFSAKHVFGMGVFLNAVLTVFSPISAQASYVWLIVMRVGMGIAGGVTLPAMHVLIAKWAPPQERSKISSTIYAGMTLGTLVCIPFSGLLASSINWEAVFYVQGGLSIVWYILWLFLVYDSPGQHPRITQKEKRFIEEAIGTPGLSSGEKFPVPWKKVWTSPAVWAIIVAHTCSNWGWYMLLVKLPTYMRYILHFDIKANAGLSSVPFLCMWVFTMVFANVLDFLRVREVITTTFARKLATSVASFLPGICLILVTYVGCHTAIAVLLLTLGTMFVGGMYPGFLSNHIDIAPPFAGTLMGITNTFATVPGIVVPSIVGFITYGNQTVEAWRLIFFITLGIYLVEAIVYILFASGEEQEWAKRPKRLENTEEMRLK